MYQTQNPKTIQALFANIATSYDRMNTVMSFGLHNYWNRALAKSLSPKPEHEFLDLCAGTGAIAEIYLKLQPSAQKTILIDFCAPMLEIAKKRIKRESGLEFIVADACNLPLKDSSLDSIAMAYGLRNIQNKALAISECLRVLKPGGTLAILELTRPKSRLLRWLHGLWLQLAVPGLGQWLSPDKEAYEYLERSIRHFQEPHEVLSLLSQSGFIRAQHRALSFQTASIFLANKPQ